TLWAAISWSRPLTWHRPSNSRRAVRFSTSADQSRSDRSKRNPGMELDDHLFRREAGRMVSVLTRIFGAHNLALAEDVVQDAFCRAVETWPVRGIPENPAAWLMATAKNRALDVLRRERTARTFAPELGRLIDNESTLTPMMNELFSADAIK